MGCSDGSNRVEVLMKPWRWTQKTHGTTFILFVCSPFNIILTSNNNPTTIEGTRVHASRHARATNAFHSISMVLLHSICFFSSVDLVWWIRSCTEKRANNPPEIPGIQMWTLGTESIRSSFLMQIMQKSSLQTERRRPVGGCSPIKSCRNPPCK